MAEKSYPIFMSFFRGLLDILYFLFGYKIYGVKVVTFYV